MWNVCIYIYIYMVWYMVYGMVYIVAYINNIDEVLAIESNSLIIWIEWDQRLDEGTKNPFDEVDRHYFVSFAVLLDHQWNWHRICSSLKRWYVDSKASGNFVFIICDARARWNHMISLSFICIFLFVSIRRVP